MSEAIPGCPELQGIAAIVSAFPLAHTPSLATPEDRHYYAVNTLSREDDAPEFHGWFVTDA